MQYSNYKASTTIDHSAHEIDMPNYIFPSEIPIDPESSLDQLTSRFRALRDGLPELIKNSKDQYSRLQVVDTTDRQIVVMANTDQRTLSVLDFAGAPAENFEGWTIWSDPSAGKTNLASDIEAGHGNGGKAFMVRGATANAFLESCYKGRRTRKGFVNNQPGKRYKPGFAVISGVKLDNVVERDPDSRLEELLATIDMSIQRLPDRAKAAFAKRKAFTIAHLERVVDWTGQKKKKKIKDLATNLIPEIIASHGQTAMTIETCEVWVMVDGRVLGDGPVRPTELAPYPGFEQPREFEIPDVLPDPETGDAVNVLNGQEGPRFLRLHTSLRQLQMSHETKARNVLRVWNNRNNVATWSLRDLHSISTVGFIFGELRCPSLVGEHLAGADRLHLSDTSLARALKHWTEEKVKELADDLHQAMMEDSKPKDREQARAALSSIRELMRRYLDPDSAGEDRNNPDSGSIAGNKGKGQTGDRNRPPFGSRIDEIHLEPDLGDVTLISGTSVPLIYRCFERQEDGSMWPVRNMPVVLRSTPEKQFELDRSGMLSAVEHGIGEIWLETPDSSVHSNHKEVWVGAADSVDMEIPPEALLQGQRAKLQITFQTPEGPIDDALIDGNVLDSEMGAIGRHGRFTAGMKEGAAVVRVRYGADHSQVRDFSIPIGADRVPPPEGRGNQGGDVPEILFCGDIAPGKEGHPDEQRTVPGGAELPTIIEDPLFPNIVWINPSSKEAMRVRKSGGGSSGVGRVASKTFIHFVALKCFDILKRLHIRQKIAGGMVTEFQYMQYAVEAEMECADFVDAAWELSDQLLSRTGDNNG